MISGTHKAVEDPRNKDIKIYINGELLPREDAKISVFDSGYLVGDGIWEAFRIHKGKMLFVQQHLDRMWQSAKVIGLQLPFTKEELLQMVQKTLDVNNMKDHVHTRVMVTRGIKKTPSQDPRLTISGPNVVIIAEHKIAAEDVKDKGISLFTSTIRRGSPDYLDPRLNCHSKLHEVQALIQALDAGADEALMLDIHGFVSTCNATNFFMVKDGEVWTSTGQYCMNGITRANIIQVCQENQIGCKEKNFSLFDVYGADECFVTGSFGGVTPVIKIDGKIIGEGVIGSRTKTLSSLYQELIAKEVKAI
ncbi:aminotransferase class IV [uncultured Marivirga sp.]|uniref:aminotransferase class IV n=1 Tax=uncultured Marivirga sp. TaxID=1123707 RepID=UPI0030EE25D9|tara:strand:+ start:67740 stop:68657 length:918 start_codon:yes stop_codon:yes gene_type:complete